MAFSPSSATLAIAGQNICLWDIAATSCVTGFGSAYSVAFSPDGKILATGNQTGGGNYDDGTIRLWNVATRSQIGTVTDPKSQGTFSVAFSPDGRTVAAGDDNGRTYLWNVATGKLTATFPDRSSKGIQSVAFNPDGKILVSGDGNGRTYLWNTAAGKLITTFPGPIGKGVISVACSPDGMTIAARATKMAAPMSGISSPAS